MSWRIRLFPSGPSNVGLIVEYRAAWIFAEEGGQIWRTLCEAFGFQWADAICSDAQVYGSYLVDGVYPPLELWSSGLTPFQTVDAIVNLTVGRTFATWTLKHHWVQSSLSKTSADVREMQFDGLSPGEIYNLSVAAVSAAGVGPFTEELELRACNYSSAPRDLHVADQSVDSIVLAWDEPLVVGQSYEFFVEALSAAGVGPESRSQVLTAYAATKPSAPENFAADLEELNRGAK
eukprot:Skav207756  [mRNA]  locus=scaffold181:196282:201185:+ [translate_table: standard]